MPRQLLRDGAVVTDDWQYLTELEATAVADGTVGHSESGFAGSPRSAGAVDGSAIPGLIIPYARFSSERDHWVAHAGRLGVVLLPADKVEFLGDDLARFALVAAEFPGPSDGRGYTQGRLLRERYGFTGELRAAGYVRLDQLFFLARCGFNSFQLAENDLAGATKAFSTFSAEYQPSNDEGLRHTLQHR